MNKFIFYVLFIFFISFQSFFPQEKDSLVTFYLNKGIEALLKNDLESAKDLFKSSIREKDNAPAEFELAKTYRLQKSHSFLNLSQDHIKTAVKLEPNNIEYRLFYASLSVELFNTSNLEFPAWNDAIKQYNKVIELDSSNLDALKGLAQLKRQDFEEQHWAGSMDTKANLNVDINYTGRTKAEQFYNLYKEPVIKSEKFAQEEFKLAESALLNLIKFYPDSPDAYYQLAVLYESNQIYDKGIYYLKNFTDRKPKDEKGHLYLGLLYYEVSKIDSAYWEYDKAINSMPEEEREDFTFNSVKILLQPYLGSKMQTFTDSILEQIINIYWEAHNPLYLSEYNMRLLEHYSRVAYSNLWFGVPSLNMPGWKTDRGKIMIRYGFPSSRLILSAQAISQALNPKSKTEIWTYSDKTFAFTDEIRNGNFQLAQNGFGKVQAQYWDDSEEFAKDLEKTQPEEYHPKFEGPVFNVPYNMLEFKNPYRQGLTDLYVNYGIKVNKDSLKGASYNFNHNAGIFFFDKYFNRLAEMQATISSLKLGNMITVSDSGNFLVHSLSISTKPDSGNFSFELVNNSDKGTVSYHFGYKMENFSDNKLDISDLLLASKITNNLKGTGTINRKQISILPNPVNIFETGTMPYIYYELYNLQTNTNGTTNFTQEILLQNAELKEKETSVGKIIGSIIKFVSKGNPEYNVGISSNYQTDEKNAQMYFQIDMAGYNPADYILTVKIKDNLSGEEINKSTIIKWK